MSQWKELGLGLLWTIYYCFESVILALIPGSFRTRKSVAGQIVLITGAGSGLGRLVALRLSRLGARLVLWDVNVNGLEETKNAVVRVGGEAFIYECDVANRENVYLTANRVREDVGNVDILVNNAGIVNGRHFLETPDDRIQKVMDVNINAHYWTLKAFLPHMVEQNHGHVVTVSSIAGRTACLQLVDYCASKFAATGLHESLAMEIFYKGKDGVHFTNICPFFINTGMFEGVKVNPWLEWMMPLLDSEYVADKIVDGILLNQYEVLIPRSMYFISVLRVIFPHKATRIMEKVIRVEDYMTNFVGREGQGTKTRVR